MKLFKYEGGLFTFVNLLCRITLLNLIWAACCLPVVTIGASCCGQHYASKCLHDGDVHVWKNFKSGFSSSFRQATFLWLIYTALTVLCYIAYKAFSANAVPYSKVFITIDIIAFVTLFFTELWSAPVIISFTGSVTAKVYNAFILSFKHAPWTLLFAAAYVLLIYVILKHPIIRVMCILFGPTLIAYLKSCVFNNILKKYTEAEEQ